MKTFKDDYCKGKVWIALEAIVKGLEWQEYLGNVVEMRTYGVWCDKQNKSYAGAATCAIQFLADTDFMENIERPAGKMEECEVGVSDYSRFEYTMDLVSTGILSSLFNYFGKNTVAHFTLPPLNNSNWRNVIDQYTKMADYFKRQNI